MPLVWTAVDLTPYMIDPRNKFIQSQTDDTHCAKTTECKYIDVFCAV